VDSPALAAGQWAPQAQPLAAFLEPQANASAI
jgi:hypothetical protein